MMWQHLRLKQLDGWRFRRQHGIGPYIVDFCCKEAGLVVEIDGGQHARATQADARRTTVLRGWGYRVLRFWNPEVTSNLDAVLERIRQSLPKKVGG